MYEYKALSASMQQVSAHFWTPSTFCALRGDLNRGWVAGDGFSYPKKASSEVEAPMAATIRVVWSSSSAGSVPPRT